MLSPLYVATCYIIIFISIPFLINTTNVGALIPTLANHLKIDYYFYQIEPIVLCLGLVTFYAYVFLGFLKDVIQHQQQSHSPYIKLEHGSRQLQELFPSFVITAILLYVNTTRFDSLRNSFIMFQTFLLILLPIAHLHSKPFPGLLCKFFFRSVLLWSIIYALWPREAHFYLSELTQLFSMYLGLDTYAYTTRNRYYPSNYHAKDYRFNRQGYGQQWMLY